MFNIQTVALQLCDQSVKAQELRNNPVSHTLGRHKKGDIGI